MMASVSRPGRSHARRLRRRKQLPDPVRVGGIARELPALRFFHELKGAALFDVFDFQFLERRCDFRFFGFRKFVRQEFVRFACAFDSRREALASSERFLRAEKQRLDDLRKRHDKEIKEM